ncbi:diphthine--ammonia ligase [Chloroflexota bacterium]
MTLALVSWSGGKDCAYAAYLARQAGIEPAYLFNMATADGQYSRSHGQKADILMLQAQAMGLPLVLGYAGDDDYEAQYKLAAGRLFSSGITEGVFGDIDFNPHREWVERVCGDIGITPHLPLFGMSQEDVMAGFLAAGFQAVVVAVQADLLPVEILGWTVDADFLEYIRSLGLTPCGEAGEYHTLVTDGPLFNKRLEVGETARTERYNYHVMEISELQLAGK